MSNLVADYLGPSAFYDILHRRAHSDQIFLRRNIRFHQSKRKKWLELKLQNQSFPKSGRLIVSCAVADVSGEIPSNLIIDYIEEKSLKKGDTCRDVFHIPLPSKNASIAQILQDSIIQHGKSRLIIIAFATDTISVKANVIAADKVIENLFNMFRNVGRQEKSGIYFTILELENISKYNKMHDINSDIFTSNDTCRKFFLPTMYCKQTIILNQLPKVFSMAFSNSSKSGINIELSIKKVLETSQDLNFSKKDVNKSHKIFSSAHTKGENQINSIQPNLNRNTTDSGDVTKRSGKLNSSIDQASGDVKLFYHFTCLSADTEQDISTTVEYESTLICPWCPFTVTPKGENKVLMKNRKQLIIDLLQHLVSFHNHFIYEAVVDVLLSLHIIVRRNLAENYGDQNILEERIRPYSYFKKTKYPGYIDLLQDIHLPILDFSVNESNSSKQKRVKSDRWISNSASSVNSSDNAMIDLNYLKEVHSRQYYHARLGIPMNDYEFLYYDSDEDIDMSWEKKSGNRGLDEFEDICHEEKEFMKIWNIHINAFPPYSNAYIPLACQLFVRKFGFIIIKKKLRHNFLLHLLNLVDCNLIGLDAVQKSVTDLDSVAMAL
jgi:hypothetical protein